MHHFSQLVEGLESTKEDELERRFLVEQSATAVNHQAALLASQQHLSKDPVQRSFLEANESPEETVEEYAIGKCLKSCDDTSKRDHAFSSKDVMENVKTHSEKRAPSGAAMVRYWRGTFFQPFAVKMFPGIWNAHPRYATKTVMVKNNDVDGAFHLLNRLMDSEGLLKIIRRTQRYQKPWMQRNLMSIEASKAIFNEDMNRKMKFLVRKNRPDAYPGQITS